MLKLGSVNVSSYRECSAKPVKVSGDPRQDERRAGILSRPPDFDEQSSEFAVRSQEQLQALLDPLTISVAECRGATS